ncbi:response regulator [Actinokineospora auranticolor]|nr:response regulator [Actinokineospora auranticolor]
MTSRGSTGPAAEIDVLLVEDDEGDVIMIREAFEQRQPGARLHVVNDGIEAVAFLRRADGYTDAPRPDLILLDLNMPRMDGREVLAEVETDPALTAIPIVVLTTSGAPEDIARSYTLYANAYITKPTDLDDFMTIVGKIDEFFGTTVTLPT